MVVQTPWIEVSLIEQFHSQALVAFTEGQAGDPEE
jgi:hypothetical protein